MTHSDKTGLSREELFQLGEIFAQVPGLEKVVLFGSRAKVKIITDQIKDVQLLFSGSSSFDLSN